MALNWLKRLLGLGAGSGEAPGQRGGPDGTAAAVPMISCGEALERLYEYLDGELDEAAAAGVAHHFEICAACYPHLAFERSFLDALERARSGTETPEPLRARVLDVLRQEGFTPTGAQ